MALENWIFGGFIGEMLRSGLSDPGQFRLVVEIGLFYLGLIRLLSFSKQLLISNLDEMKLPTLEGVCACVCVCVYLSKSVAECQGRTESEWDITHQVASDKGRW